MPLLALAGCQCGTPPAPGASAEDASALALTALEPASVELPADSRDGEEPSAEMSLDGTWRYAGKSKAGMHKWRTPVPIRPRNLFFHNPQRGMVLRTRDGSEMAYGRGFNKTPHETWSYTKKDVIVYRPEKGQAPSAGDYVFVYDKAVERERAMNRAWSERGSIASDFLVNDIHYDWDSRRGLMLPAPGKVSWEVTVPVAGELLFTPGLVPPEVATGELSDGAVLLAEWTVGGETHALGEWPVSPGQFDHARVDLGAWAGQSGTLTFRSEPGLSSRFDYVFLGEPVLSSRRQDPRRVVLVFIDTLRPDHMSLYGYERDTSKAIDEWAEGAAVFSNARSVAPWTLPSSRTVLTGRHPEYYSSTPTLQRQLVDEGFQSAMFAGNVYLSTNFQMARDWGLHRVGMWPSAEVVTDDALAWLADREGHDVVLQVHYMDPHLPYIEPRAYRFLYAGDSPTQQLREEFHLSDVRRLNPQDQATRTYIRDRYDNNIRYATDQVARLLEALDETDVVVLYADHGEEFWDHTGFEHGHTLFDELLRVPLVIKAPGVSGVRSDVPASLLDITPTVLESLGLDVPESLDGESLLGVARGEPADHLSGRQLAFGRPLYGGDRWGVLTQDARKWTTHEGREALYDVGADREERNNLIRNQAGEAGEPYRRAFGEALEVDVGVGFRLVGTNNRGGMPACEMAAFVEVPGGAKRAWVEHDPLDKARASVETSEDGTLVKATWSKQSPAPATVWIIPNEPLEDVTHQLKITAQMCNEERVVTVDPKKPAGLTAFRTPLALAQFQSRMLRLTVGIAPMFGEDAVGVVGNDEEMQNLLEEMGYAVGEDEVNKKPVQQLPEPE